MGSEYEAHAARFLRIIGAKMRTRFLEYRPYFPSDAESRDVFRVNFSRDDGRRFNLTFGQSIHNSTGGGDNPPTAYDILAAIKKNDPGDLEEFASNFGYDEYDPETKRIYRAVVKEWEKVSHFFDEDELEELQEIQ